MPCCVHPCHCVLSQPVASPHSRSTTPKRPTFTQRWERGRFRATPNMGVFGVFFLWHGALATVWCTICWPDLPKVLRGCQCKSSSRYGPVHFVDKFCRSRSESAETETLLRRPQQPHCPTKAQGFVPGSAFTCEFKRFRTVTLRNCLMMGGWHGDAADKMMWLTWWPRQSFPTKLPLDCILICCIITCCFRRFRWRTSESSSSISSQVTVTQLHNFSTSHLLSLTVTAPHIFSI